MIGIFFSLVTMYMTLSVAVYFYIVVMNYEVTEEWNFKIDDFYIGVLPYPKWMLWWLKPIVGVIKWK
jgi:hypothetical protein